MIANRLIVSLIFFAALANTHAGDDRVGFATHFGHGYSTNLMPYIAASGAGWIRDDITWARCETTKGVYAVDPLDQGWLDAAAANGLKVVAILNPNPLYADKWDPTAAAAFCSWLAKTVGPKIAAIEVINEPNNDYAADVGPAWKTKLVTLTNAIYNAVKAVNPQTQVIGLGAQGDQILSMLPSANVSGVVYHPYDPATGVPESAYEWPYYDYQGWVTTLRSKTLLPFWETEWGYGVKDQYRQANFTARRLLMAMALNIEHTFIYDFYDAYSDFGVMLPGFQPKQALPTIRRIISALTGVRGTTQAVQINSYAPGFDSASLKSYIFYGAKKTVVALWFGGHPPSAPQPSSKCSISFTVPNVHTHSTVVNPISGSSTSLSATYGVTKSGTKMTVSNVVVSDQPTLLIIE